MRDLQYLAISGLLSQYQWLMELTRLAGHHDCQILQMQVHHHAEVYSVNLFLHGKWSAIAKMESALHLLQKKENLNLHVQRISVDSAPRSALTYLLYLSTTEDAHVLHKVLRFLEQEPLTLQDVQVDRYPGRYTHTPVTHATLRIHLSTQLPINEWRERFILFCDDLNIDAAMEPEKA